MTSASSRLVALGVGLLVLGTTPTLRASQRKPQVTNGGYMQTQIAGGEAVPLPLKHTDVEAEVAGMVSAVKVTQQFENPYKKPIEAIYVFPLPHRAAIHQMQIKVGRRTIKATIKKRAEAKAIYRRAKAAGKTAGLLEQERPNIFTQSVANIMPGDKIQVTIRYVEQMVPQDGRYSFTFPMVVGPRYVGGGEAAGTRKGSGWGTDTTRIPDASRITPPLLKKGQRPGHDIALRLRINGGVKLSGLRVVAHRASVTHDAQRATVVLDKADAIPNKDFVVRYALAGKRPEVAVLTQRDKRGGHFMLMIQPKARMQQRDIAPREYVFVVDNSGSMSGFPTQQARAVMGRCLGNLRGSDTFQIIKFAGRPDQFAPRAVRATHRNVRAALAYVSQMRGRGGTEFMPALRLALTAKKDPSRSRIVLFITDGYIGYERQVLKFLRDNIKGINLFALGIGSSVNRYLIDGMARMGSGSPFYLLNTEKAPKVVQRIFATISKPALTSIDIDWGGLDVEQLTPSAVPDLFGEKPVVVVGRYGRAGEGTVTIRGRLAGRRFTRKLQVKLPAAKGSSNLAVAYLWARRQIADAMDLLTIEPQHAGEVEKSVTRLALRYSLMSRWTSFVAVDSRVRNQGGRQQSVAVPVPLPQGVTTNAAPARAYASSGYMGRRMRRKSSRSYAPPAPAAVPMALGAGRGGGAMAAEQSVTRKPRPTRRPRPRMDSKAEDRDDSRSQRARARVLLVGMVRVDGGAASARLQARLRLLARRLSVRLKSLGHGPSRRVKLRLVLDGTGRVKRVAYISGTLMAPSLRSELLRQLRRWTLPSARGKSSIVLTLAVR